MFSVCVIHIGISESTIDNNCPYYPNKIQKMFNELRYLTEEIKTYYAIYTILIIFESVLLFVSSVTKLTINYTNGLEMKLLCNNFFIIYCILKMIFLFFIVHEAHNTVQEVSKVFFLFFFFVIFTLIQSLFYIILNYP